MSTVSYRPADVDGFKISRRGRSGHSWENSTSLPGNPEWFSRKASSKAESVGNLMRDERLNLPAFLIHASRRSTGKGWMCLLR